MTKFWKVGGAVRDTFLGVKPKDIDFAVEAESFGAMCKAVTDKGGKIFQSKPEFLTIRAKVPGIGGADFVLCRKDGAYNDGRHPETVSAGSIFDDLARRDFTMNAIAINAEDDMDVQDPHGGIADIAFGWIRCVGNPDERFSEDALRVFRALRFAITLKFKIEQRTRTAIHTACEDNNFANISTERIREELCKMFAADWLTSFRTLDEFNLISLVKERGIWLKPTSEDRCW